MYSYKDEDLINELLNTTVHKNPIDIDEDNDQNVKNDDIEEILSFLDNDEIHSSPESFPIQYLMDQMDSSNSFLQIILDNENVFNHVLLFIFSHCEAEDFNLDPPENYQKCKDIPKLQDNNLCSALFYIDNVIKQNKEAIQALPEQFLTFLLKVIYCSKGKVCQWALHLLTVISSEAFEKLEQFQYVSRVGEVFKYCLDQDIQCFALQALEPFFAFSDDYKRKKRIFDFIHSKFSLMTPKLKQSALSLFEEYIQSSEKDMKYAARNNLLQDCISLLHPGHYSLLTKQACFIVYYFINNGLEEYLQDSVTYGRLIQQIRTLITCSDTDILIPAYNLLDAIVDKATPSLPLFHDFMIPKYVCDNINNSSNDVKKIAISVISKFIKQGDAELLINIINEDVINPILDTFESLDHDTQITFLQGLMHIFSMDVSVYESLDSEDLIESLDNILQISHEIADISTFIIERIHQLQ